MEKNTGSSSGINEKKNWIAVSAWRFMVSALLASAVVSAALPDSTRAEIGMQTSYMNASFSAGASPAAAKIGDLNGDGLNDIAVINPQGSLQLFFNNGAGSFERVSINGLWSSSSNTLDLDIGDLNGDGLKDIAVAFSTMTGAVSVLLNRGNRAFAAPVNYASCRSSKGVAIGDLDQDGDNDLADISDCSRASILLNNGGGSFALSSAYGDGYASKSIGLGDLNGDGFKDIAYVNNGLGRSRASSITVAFNNRDATFGSYTWHFVGDGPDDLSVSDFDGDGDADIAIANSYLSEVFILLNDGAGNFPSYSEFYGGDTPTSIASADLNRDGLLDIAVTSWASNSLSVFINQGDYSFAGPTRFNVGQSPVDVAAGDLDGDSLPDLVAVNQGSGSITVLFSAGGAPPPPPPPQITLTVSTRTTKKARFVDLRWSGATSSSMDIYRNGARIATASNTGGYTEQFNLRASGTFTYRVCVAGGQVCSNEATISF
jgi:hypothetical protein